MKKYTDEQIEKAMQMYIDGKSFEEISKTVGMGNRTITYYRQQRNIPTRIYVAQNRKIK